ISPEPDPESPSELSKLTPDQKKWLTDVYGYCSLALSMLQDPTARQWFPSPEVTERKVRWYLCGTGADCLATDANYTSINKTCANLALLALRPGLKDYAKDGKT